MLHRILGTQKQKKKFKEIKTEGFIYATLVFSHGWNDQSEHLNNRASVILDIVPNENDIESKLNYWNKLYYDNITRHFSIGEEQLDSISTIINITKDKFRELYKYWPKALSEEQYDQIFDRLNLKFVQFKPLQEQHKGKYVIKVNESFWKIKTHNSTLLNDIMNTYEAELKDFELIHNTYESAMNYGIIIVDRLCNQRDPNNPYYYEQRIKDQLRKFKNLPIFNYNIIDKKEELVIGEYNRIIKDKEFELKIMKETIEVLKIKPFEILKIMTMPNNGQHTAQAPHASRTVVRY
ncbi:hypothetical protein [Catalinimonas alkaloidigena]|uniref:hypothetical protein n=1 Tax=Catalinimonas alkaloidigena TaxID=1075417 RepID=UPI001C408D0D|nr:hypothetical protein [Catalinimonas alkaloidigena]